MPVIPCFNSEENKPGYKVKNTNGCPHTYNRGDESSRKSAKERAYQQMYVIDKSKGGLAEHIARAFHETYEKLAPDFGYETRAESRTNWENIPLSNKELMIATVLQLLDDGVIKVE